MIQIIVNSRVSTECYRLDKDTGNCKNRWSFLCLVMIGETEESMGLLNHEPEEVNGLGNGMLIR